MKTARDKLEIWLPNPKGKKVRRYSSKALRRLPPKTRQLAKLANSIDSDLTKIRNLIDHFTRIEMDSAALNEMLSRPPAKPNAPDIVDIPLEGEILSTLKGEQ